MLGENTQFSDFQICAWCNDFLNPDIDDIDQAICHTCLNELGKIPVLNLVNISREFVDSLPIGNIVLNPDDKVIRYNATESEFTGYDSSQIEGKHFFHEVAPCTAVDNFYGKLKKFRLQGESNQYLFKFNFNHERFNTLVSILMTYYKNGYVVLSIKKLQSIDN